MPPSAPSTTTEPVPPAESTTVPPTVDSTAPPATGIVPGEDHDVDAIAYAFAVAFDSVSDPSLKMPLVEDSDDLESTIATYLTTGASMGGISVVVTTVVIDGDSASVGYDLLFGGNPTYPDLSGMAVRTGEGWKVTRRTFCSLMSSARVGCPGA